MEALSGTLRALPDAGGEEREECLTVLLAEWLRFSGPINPECLAATLGLPRALLAPALGDLLDTQKLIQGPLLRDGAEDDCCDSDNFEILLRMTRSEAAPNFQPLPGRNAAAFPRPAARLLYPGDDVDDLAIHLMTDPRATPKTV